MLKADSKGLVHSSEVPKLLGITKAEYDRWKGTNIPVTTYKSFRKWGQTLNVPYYSASSLAEISPTTIEAWRLSFTNKSKSLKTGKLEEAKVSESCAKRWLLLQKDAANITSTATHKGQKIVAKIINNSSGWGALITGQIENTPFKLFKKFKEFDSISPTRIPKGLLDKLKMELTSVNLEQEVSKAEKAIDNLEITQDERLLILQEVSAHFTCPDSEVKESTFKTIVTNAFKLKVLPARLNAQASALISIATYENNFPLARSLSRKLTIIHGPTNSGKTYEAMKHLMSAESGVYLAPLRLLALEAYQRLKEAGIKCNLITGEEHIIEEGAHHTCSTVEVLNPLKEVEVAVIDECQMIFDNNRGWAWTAAIVGVPAKKVFTIGSIEALNVIKNIALHLKEETEIKEFSRLSPLKVLPSNLNLSDLKKGDALIAFSRIDVLAYATLLKDMGFKVSVIYGALSPEVRNEQANKFADGTTDIVVATDAIGMGLNLPINRVLLSSMHKYDGKSSRALYVTEVLQIAGRAGRFGYDGEGYVGLLTSPAISKKSKEDLEYAINQTLKPVNKTVAVAPNLSQIHKFSEVLRTNDLGAILRKIATMADKTDLFHLADISNQITLFEAVPSKIWKKYPLEAQYRLVCAPVSVTDSSMLLLYKELIKGCVARTVVRPSICKNIAELEAPPYFTELQILESQYKLITLYTWIHRIMEPYPEKADKLSNKGLAKLAETTNSIITKELLIEKTYEFSKTLSDPRTRIRFDEDRYWRKLFY